MSTHVVLWRAQQIIEAKARGIGRKRRIEEKKRKEHRHKLWCRLLKICCAGRQTDDRIARLRIEEYDWREVGEQIGRGDCGKALTAINELVRELDNNLGSAHDLFEMQPNGLDALIEKRAMVKRMKEQIQEAVRMEIERSA